MGDMDLLLPDLVLAVVFEVLTIGWEISLSLSLSCLLALFLLLLLDALAPSR